MAAYDERAQDLFGVEKKSDVASLDMAVFIHIPSLLITRLRGAPPFKGGFLLPPSSFLLLPRPDRS